MSKAQDCYDTFSHARQSLPDLPVSLTRGTAERRREMRNRIRRRCPVRTGAAAVEFALVAPVFLVLIFGMIEFGRAIMVQQTITNASREGARVAVLDGTTTAQVNTTVNNYLSNSRIPSATVSMQPSTPSTASYGDPVTVTVSVRFNDVSWLPSPWFLDGKTLSAQTVMRRETVQ